MLRTGGLNKQMQETTTGKNSGFEQTFRNLDDVLWKEAGCTTELDYTEQSSWMLFLKYLDDLEHERALKAELAGKSYEFIVADGVPVYRLGSLVSGPADGQAILRETVTFDEVRP